MLTEKELVRLVHAGALSLENLERRQQAIEAKGNPEDVSDEERQEHAILDRAISQLHQQQTA